jgi:hypothetical protein
MTHRHRSSEAGHDGGADDREPGIPRWVKVVVITVIMVGLLMAVMMLIGGGEHGPWRHG